jgi:hypothetical protein
LLGFKDQGQGFETFYNVAITPASHLTFDLQLAQSALPRTDTAVILAATRSELLKLEGLSDGAMCQNAASLNLDEVRAKLAPTTSPAITKRGQELNHPRLGRQPDLGQVRFLIGKMHSCSSLTSAPV